MATGNPLLDDPTFDPSKPEPGASPPAVSAAPSKGATGNSLLDDPIYDPSKPETTAEPATASSTAASPAASASTVKNWGEVPEGDITAWQAAKAGVKNFVPSAIRDVAQVGHAIVHPLDTAGSLWDVGKGLYSKMEGAAGVQQDPEQKAKDEASANAIGESISNLGTKQGFLHSVANDPAGWVMNAVPVAGGIGKAAKAAGMLGDVGGAAKVAEAAAAAKAARAATAPAADAALKGATEGALGAGDLPAAAHQAVADTFAAKGHTVPAAREGIIKAAADIRVPSNVVEGVEAAPGTEAAVNAEIARGNANIDKKMVQLAGGEAPEAGSLVRPVEQKYIDSANNVAGLYEDAFSQEGNFTPEMPDIVSEHVNSAMGKIEKGAVNTLDKLQNAPYLPQSAAAAGYLSRALATMAPEDMTLAGAESMRRGLSSFYKGASGVDKNALGKLIDGFDQGIQKAAAHPNSFEGNGAAVADKMTAARNAFKQHRATFFENKDPAYRPVSKAIETLSQDHAVDDAGMITGPASEGHARIAEANLGDALMHPKTGEATHTALMDLHGADAAGAQSVNDFVRKSILQTRQDPRGVGTVMQHNPVALHNALNSPVAAKAFTPEELAHAKLLNTGRRLLNAQPVKGGKLGASLGHELGKAGLRTAASTAGAFLHGLPGAIAGYGAERTAEALGHRMALKHALSGAAPQFGKGAIARGAKAIAKAPVTVPVAALKYATRAIPQDVAHFVNAAQQRPAHARGGKVGHQHLVDRMFREIEKAKRAEKGRTSVLLHQPDEAVAKALNLAQAAI